ncbi:DUF7344 domain-containing protein [Halorarum salinum]|uniref:DUF7344 domain-containing protein n=1 Tax=Halorarum salinum TaxID=2743089 RepID=A0A7D5L8P5_9EURY|nr:hypothetical protein [Halobaculum salinum]QLG60592.1 hypothetical protein HUG12_02060 [Halobaculum salinum]
MSGSLPERDRPERNRSEAHRRLPQVVQDGGADIDRFFDALGETRRRLVLLYLNDHGCADLDRLVALVAEHEGVETDDREVERIRLNLHHQQLPKLADHGLVSYDPRTNVACLEPLPEAVEEILDLTQELEQLDTQ